MKVERAPDRIHRAGLARCSGGVKRLQRLADAGYSKKTGSPVFHLRSNDRLVRQLFEGPSKDTASPLSGGQRSSCGRAIDGIGAG